MQKSLKRKNLTLALIITAVALLLRLVAVWQLSTVNGGANTVFQPSVQSDMATYWRLATELVTGSFSGEFYYQPFYYAIWLPMLRLFSSSQVCVGIAQALLGAATVFMVYRLTLLLSGRKSAVVAAVLTAISAQLLLYTPYLIIANLQVFWLALIAWLGVRVLKNSGRGVTNVILLGVALGCAILTRGNAYFLLPAVVILYILAYKKRAIYAILATGFLIILVQLPFIIHNSRINGQLTGPSTASAPVLTLGNTPEAPPGGKDFNTLAGAMEYPPTYEYWMSHQDELSIPARMFDWLKREPLAFSELQFRKLLLFWDWRDIPNNVAMFGEGSESYIVHLHWTTGVTLTLGVFGMLILPWRAIKRRDWSLFWVIYMILGYWAATAVFYNLSRFRAPILPLLAVVGAIAVIRFIRYWQLKRYSAYKLLIALFLGIFMVYNSFDFYNTTCEAAVMRWVRPNGTHTAGMVVDNGPLTYGDWQELTLSYGDTVTKDFAGVDSDFKGSLEITFYTQNPPQRVKFELNGQRESLVLDQVVTTESFSVTGNQMVFKALSGEINLIIDYHRNYGRTKLNEQTLDGEMVFRLVSQHP